MKLIGFWSSLGMSVARRIKLMGKHAAPGIWVDT